MARRPPPVLHTTVTRSYVTGQMARIPPDRWFRLARDPDEPEAPAVSYILALPVVVQSSDPEGSLLMQQRLESRLGGIGGNVEEQVLMYAIKTDTMAPWPDAPTLTLIKESNRAIYHLLDVNHSGIQLTNARQRRARATTKIAVGVLRATGEILK